MVSAAGSLPSPDAGCALVPCEPALPEETVGNLGRHSGFHRSPGMQRKMDSRFRGNDGHGGVSLRHSRENGESILEGEDEFPLAGESTESDEDGFRAPARGELSRE